MKTPLIISAFAIAAAMTSASAPIAAFAKVSPTESLRLRADTSQDLIDSLRASIGEGSAPVRTLSYGSTGDDVRALQRFLIAYGTLGQGSVSGYFGPLTQQAVIAFQKKESIDPIGVVGPATSKRIQERTRDLGLASTTGAAITDVALTGDIAEDGSAGTTTTRFSRAAPNIYAVVSLANAAIDTEIGYIRYHNGAYVESGVTHPSRKGLKFTHFQWSLKPGASRTPGEYTLVFYLNGAKARTLSYTIHE